MHIELKHSLITDLGGDLQHSTPQFLPQTLNKTLSHTGEQTVFVQQNLISHLKTGRQKNIIIGPTCHFAGEEGKQTEPERFLRSNLV